MGVVVYMLHINVRVFIHTYGLTVYVDIYAQLCRYRCMFIPMYKHTTFVKKGGVGAFTYPIVLSHHLFVTIYKWLTLTCP